MPKLHLFYLGGHAPGSNLEVHDVQFVACDEPEEAYDALNDRWWGEKSSLHLDGYAVVEWADGYDIALRPEPAPTDRRLFFVNLGGYVEGELAEAHRFGFFVARSAGEAKKLAKASMLVDAIRPHTDDNVAVDDCLLLADVGGFHIHLTPNPGGKPLTPAWQGYRPIGR
jgi:hypothetical protein